MYYPYANGESIDGLGRCHMFYSQRVVYIPDGKPKWTGMNDKSDLIEDSPPELIKRKRAEDNDGNSA